MLLYPDCVDLTSVDVDLVDLINAYFHITIHPGNLKFRRFAFEGTAYEFQVLLIGLSLALRIFTRCAEEALTLLRHQCSRVLLI